MDSSGGNISDLLEQVEKDLLAEIIRNLEQNKINDEQARKQARDFLNLLPIEDKKDLLDKLQKFSQANNEASEIYNKYTYTLDEEEKQKKLKQMSEHIKNGQIDKAWEVAKGDQNA